MLTISKKNTLNGYDGDPLAPGGIATIDQINVHIDELACITEARQLRLKRDLAKKRSQTNCYIYYEIVLDICEKGDYMELAKIIEDIARANYTTIKYERLAALAYPYIDYDEQLGISDDQKHRIAYKILDAIKPDYRPVLIAGGHSLLPAV